MKESVAGRSMTALELLAKATELRRSISSFKSLVAVQRALKIAEELETEAGLLGSGAGGSDDLC